MELVDIRNNIYFVRENIDSQVMQLPSIEGMNVKDIRGEVNKKLELFKTKAGLVALKLLLLHNNQSPEYNELFDKLFIQAYDLGLVTNKSQMAVDFVHHGVFFGNLLKIVTFDSAKVQTQQNVIKNIEELDVLDKNVVELSRYGLQALNYIYMNIGNEKVYLCELIKFMEQMMGANFDNVSYIGITPSNKLFKFVVTHSRWNIDCCSVAFSDWETFNKKRQEGKLVNGKSLNSYIRYVRNETQEAKFYCTKFSYKDYSDTLRGNGEQAGSRLRSKYKTLRDVYVSM